MRILLPNGEYEVLIDLEYYATFSEYNWCWDGKYVARRTTENSKRKKIYLHREIMNAPPGVMVDHISGDSLDCRKSNLRLCSAAQNMMNSATRKDNKSGYKGVHWNRQAHKWQAVICVGGKAHHLGYFVKKLDAAHAYDQAALEYFGEFARPNATAGNWVA